MLFDQPPRLGEVMLRGPPRVVFRSIIAQAKQPRPMQMNVRQEQRHRPVPGDFKGLIEVALRAVMAGARAGEKAQPGAGEEAKGGNPARRRGGGRSPIEA
jgi:hypothetical protein